MVARIRRAPIMPRSNPILEVIQKQLARLPTRRELARTALGIDLATMMLTTLSLLFFLRCPNRTLGFCPGVRLVGESVVRASGGMAVRNSHAFS